MTEPPVGDSRLLTLILDFAFGVLDTVLSLLSSALPQLMTALLDALVDLLQPPAMIMFM